MDRETVLEKEVEKYLRERVEKRGGLCVKFIPDFLRGWPDRIVLLPGGVVVWVELKRPVGGKVSASQRVAHEMLRRLGQRVEIVLTKEDAAQLVDEASGERVH